jgi:hypothetical protein
MSGIRSLGTIRRAVPSVVLALAGLGAMAQAADFDPAADPARLAAAFVKVDRLQALSKVRRAALSQFRVEFAVENEGKAQSSGTTGWTSTQAEIKLVGVTDEARQAIADALHDRFIKEIEAAGLEFVPDASLRENAAYKSLAPVLRTSQAPVGTQAGKSIFVGARGMPYYLTNDDRHLGLGTLLGAMSTTQPQNIEPEIASSLNAAVFRVTLLVAFAEQSSRGGLFNIGSSVTSAVRLALVPKLSQWAIVTPDGRARTYLDEAVYMGADAAQLVETTTDGEKVAQAVGNVITGLLAGGTRRRASFEARTTSDAYQEVVTRYGLAVQSAMMSAMRQGLTVTPPARPAAPEPPPVATTSASAAGASAPAQ